MRSDRLLQAVGIVLIAFSAAPSDAQVLKWHYCLEKQPLCPIGCLNITGSCTDSGVTYKFYSVDEAFEQGHRCEEGGNHSCLETQGTLRCVRTLYAQGNCTLPVCTPTVGTWHVVCVEDP